MSDRLSAQERAEWQAIQAELRDGQKARAELDLLQERLDEVKRVVEARTGEGCECCDEFGAMILEALE